MVINPANVRIDLAFDGDLQFKRVPVHLGALVIAGKIGQRLSRFEAEVFNDACAHVSWF